MEVTKISKMDDVAEPIRKIAEKLAKRRLKGCKRVFKTEAEEQRQYERLLTAYESDVVEYIRTDFEKRYEQDPKSEMSLLVKGFLFGPSALTEDESAEWERQMMLFDDVFDEEYNKRLTKPFNSH